MRYTRRLIILGHVACCVFPFHVQPWLKKKKKGGFACAGNDTTKGLGIRMGTDAVALFTMFQPLGGHFRRWHLEYGNGPTGGLLSPIPSASTRPTQLIGWAGHVIHLHPVFPIARECNEIIYGGTPGTSMIGQTAAAYHRDRCGMPFSSLPMVSSYPPTRDMDWIRWLVGPDGRAGDDLVPPGGICRPRRVSVLVDGDHDAAFSAL